MSKPTTQQLLTIYRASLAKYETEGATERVAIQKRLIVRLEGQSDA